MRSRRFIQLAVLLCSFACSADANPQWVMGYYVGYALDAYPISQIDWTALTHIIFSPLLARSDGTLDQSFSDAHGAGIQDAKALAAAAHAHGVKALLMLGGVGNGRELAMAAAPATRAAFVSALLKTVDALGYDGLDLDWEDSVDLDALSALAQALRAARPALLLTYPGPMINGNLQTVDPRLVTLARALDRYNIQSYYPDTAVLGSGWNSWFVSPLGGAGPSTPIAIDDSLARYAAAGIPKAKLGLGLGFYAICYTGGVTGPRQPTHAPQAITGGDNTYPLSAFFAAGGAFAQSRESERKYDTAAQEPYLSFSTPVSDPHCGGATQYISYEDEASIRAKGDYSRANGYGGLIVWQLAEGWLPKNAAGGRAQNALMQALKAGFLEPAVRKLH